MFGGKLGQNGLVAGGDADSHSPDTDSADPDWRPLLDVFTDPAAIVDGELVLLEVNEVMCARQRAGREELIGTRLPISRDSRHPTLHSEFAQLNAEEVLRIETQLSRPDGSIADGDLAATTFGPGLYVVVLRDRDSPGASPQEERSREVLDASVDAYISLDADSRVLEWNRAACEMFGWSRQEAVGRRVTDLVVRADEREWVLETMAHYVESGQSPLVGEVSSNTLQRKDGTELPVEVTVTAIGSGPQLTFHAFIRDMTEQSDARTAQIGSAASFEAVFTNAPIGIALVGLDGSFLRVNEALCRITGYQEHELTQLTFQDITHPFDLDTDVHEATRLLNGEIPSYQMDKRCYCKDGHLVWIRLSGSLVRDTAGQPLNFIAHIEDISARKRDEELLRRRATRDALTGVFNRSRFEEELDRYVALAARHAYMDEAAVLMIDVDGLKRVNDREGHAAGDDYLKSVANAISHRLRLSDVFARIGGDEFAALLPHTPTAHAQKLGCTLVEEVRTHSRGSVSIGIAMISPGRLEGAMERADAAMYKAKKLGPGRCFGP